MLAIGRKIGERLLIAINGEIIIVELGKIRRTQVRLRVGAPPHAIIIRDELLWKGDDDDPIETLRVESLTLSQEHRGANNEYFLHDE